MKKHYLSFIEQIEIGSQYRGMGIIADEGEDISRVLKGKDYSRLQVHDSGLEMVLQVMKWNRQLQACGAGWVSMDATDYIIRLPEPPDMAKQLKEAIRDCAEKYKTHYNRWW